MNTSTNSNNILEIARHLNAATQSLAALSGSALTSNAPRVKRAYNRKVKPVTPVESSQKDSSSTESLPPRLAARVKALQPKKYKRLSPEERDDIALLLERTSISVDAIAKMFGVTRASIYNLRDKRNLPVRKASKALMDGIAKMKARTSSVNPTPKQEEAPLQATG